MDPRLTELRETIKKNSTLREHSNIGIRFLDKCISAGVLNKDEKDAISTRRTDYARSSAFYDVLLTKDYPAFEKVLKIMNEGDTRQSGVVLDVFWNFEGMADSSGFEDRRNLRYTGSLKRSETCNWEEVARKLLEGNLMETFKLLHLADEDIAGMTICETEGKKLSKTETLDKFVECLTYFGRYGDILDTLQAYRRIQETESLAEKFDTDYFIAYALYLLKRPDEALGEIQKIYRLQRSDKSKLLMARLLSDLKRNKEALELLSDFQEFPKPLCFTAKLYRAIVLSRLGRLEEAENECRNVLSEQNDPLVKAETEFELGIILADSRSYDEAESYFRSVANTLRRKLGPEHPRTLAANFRNAEALSNMAKNSDAQDIIEKVLEKQRRFGEAHEDYLRSKRCQALILSRLGKYAEAQKIYVAVHLTLENYLGRDHASTLRANYEKGLNLVNLTHYDEALSVLEEVARAQIRTLGSTHYSTLRTKSDIAFMKLELEPEESLTSTLEGIINCQIKELHEDHPDTLRSKRFLAQALCKFGYYNKAITAFEEIRVLQDAKGSDHSSTLETKYQLGLCYKYARKFESAQGILRKVYTAQSKKLHKEHPLTIRTQTEIASTTSEIGDNQTAVDLLQNILETQELPNLSNPLPVLDLLRAKMYYGQVLARRGQTTDGKQRLEEVLKEQHRLLGPDHRVTLDTKYQIATIYADMSDHNEALRTLKDLYRAQKRTLGEDHIITLRTRTDIAWQLSEKGDNKEASEEFIELELKLQQNPDTEANKLRARRYDAVNKARLGQFQEALTILDQVAKLQEDIHGSEHPSVLETHYQRAKILFKMKNNEDAEMKFTEILNAQSGIAAAGDKHAKALRTKISLHALEFDLKRTEDWISLFEELSNDCKETLGERHKYTLKVRRYEAQAKANVGEHTEALKLFKELKKTQEDVLGRAHPATLETNYHMALTMEKMSNFQEALDNLQSNLKIQRKAFPPDHPSLLRTKQEIDRIEKKVLTISNSEHPNCCVA